MHPYRRGVHLADELASADAEVQKLVMNTSNGDKESNNGKDWTKATRHFSSKE